MSQYFLRMRDALPVGKYKGEACDDIIKQDPRYMKWMCDQEIFELDDEATELLDRQ